MILMFFILCCGLLNSAIALEERDQSAIEAVIYDHTDSWNRREGKGFADGFTEDADFVNIFGMHFSGRAEIESRHEKILQTFLKGSTLEIVDVHLREVQLGVVIARISWRLSGYRTPGSDMSKSGEVRTGIYTQVFINTERGWKITAFHNTLQPIAGH